MREIELSMSMEHIKEAIKNYLYVHGPSFKQNEAIENISFDTKLLKSKDNKIIPMTLAISEEEEVKILKF